MTVTPQNPNLALPNEIQKIIGTIDTEKNRREIKPTQTLFDIKTGHTSLFRQLLQTIEPKFQVERKDREDAMGSIEYLFTLGLDKNNNLLGNLKKGNTDATSTEQTVRFINGYLDLSKDKPLLIHYHGSGYLSGKTIPFFSQEDIAFALSNQIPPTYFILHTQNYKYAWILVPDENLTIAEKSFINKSSVPVVNDVENTTELSQIALFVRKHRYTLYKTPLKGFKSQFEQIR